MSSNNHSHGAGTKKVEYDFIPTFALGTIIIILVIIVIGAVAFIWNVLNKYSTETMNAAQRTSRNVIVNENGEVIQVLAYRKANAALIATGGVDKATGVRVEPIEKAMERLVNNPAFLSKLPTKTAAPAPAPRRAPSPVGRPPDRRVPDPILPPRKGPAPPRRPDPNKLPAPVHRPEKKDSLPQGPVPPRAPARRAPTRPAVQKAPAATRKQPAATREAAAPAPRREQPNTRPAPTPEQR